MMLGTMRGLATLALRGLEISGPASVCFVQKCCCSSNTAATAGSSTKASSDFWKPNRFVERFSSLIAEDDARESVIGGLKKLYKNQLLPLEKKFLFHEFHSPALQDADFDSKPLVLLIGQYSTGKSSMIRYMMRQDFPGVRIGPEPTTDKFIVIHHGEKENVIPGHALAVDSNKQFGPLANFGSAFLNRPTVLMQHSRFGWRIHRTLEVLVTVSVIFRYVPQGRFQCSVSPSPVLKGLSIIDTPGILSGEKQRVDRGYDFANVIEWFAQRVDRILLLFDAHKLDISDEFRQSIEAMKGQEDKVRIVLNKADMVDHQELMRVYGALMWSLGKVFGTPEVARVYIGSFWDHELRHSINQKLYADEEKDLFHDLHSLTQNATLRKINDIIKRARLLKVHAQIIGDLAKEMPVFFGRGKAQDTLIENLDATFRKIQHEQNVPVGDFPDVKRMQQVLKTIDFKRLSKVDKATLRSIDKLLANDIANLVAQLPYESLSESSSQ